MSKKSDHEEYQHPIAQRNASAQMVKLFSPSMKFGTWRRLWLALAQAQRELGLKITARQLREMASHLDDIDYKYAAKMEKKLRHDVMAHIHTFAKAAPAASAESARRRERDYEPTAPTLLRRAYSAEAAAKAGSTSRSAGCPCTTQDSLPAAALLCRAGFHACRVPPKGFSGSSHRFPLSQASLAQR